MKASRPGDRISADDISHQTNTVEQPKEVGQDKPSPMLGRDSDLNEQVVPIAELRLLAKTRELNSSTDNRARFRRFVAGLLVIAVVIAVGRFLYPEVELEAKSVEAVLPEQPVSSPPAPQTAEVEHSKADILSDKPAELPAPSMATAVSPPPAPQTAEVEQSKTDILSDKPAELPAPSMATADNSAELLNQRLEMVVRDLAAVQASVQQLAAKQDEITRSIAELQKGKNVRPAPLPPPSPRAAARTANQLSNALPLQPANPAANTDVQQPSTSMGSRDPRTQVPRPPLPVRGN
jgi:hypothetical protein